jgi:hypothetical protein
VERVATYNGVGVQYYKEISGKQMENMKQSA